MYILYMFAFIHGICNVHVITGDHYIMDFSTDCSVCEREREREYSNSACNHVLV